MGKPVIKNKGGRPKEKVSDKIDFDKLILLCEKGFTDVELAEFYCVDQRTIRRWKKDDEFLSALKKGKELADSKVERCLFERATGFKWIEEVAIKIKTSQYTESVEVVPVEKMVPPDVLAAIFWLKNRKPEQWRDKQEYQHSGEIKTISEVTQFTLKSKGK